MVRLWPEVIMV